MESLLLAFALAIPPAPPPAAQRKPAPVNAIADRAVMGAPAATVELDPLLDNMRRTPTAFQVGGKTVRVFGDKSQNKKSWFLAFAEEGSGLDAQFRKGEKLLNWGFVMRGEAEVTLDGRPFRVKLNGQLRNRMQSKIEIEPKTKGSTDPKVTITVQQVSDGVFAAGHPVRLGGRDFKLLYTRNFYESDRGDFAAYSGDRSIVLMFRQGGKLMGYHWFEAAIPKDETVLIATPRAADEEDGGQVGTFTLGLRMGPRRALELYYPVPR